LHSSVLLYECSLVCLVYDGYCTSEHIVDKPFSTVCSLTHLDHDVLCISEHTALSLLSTVCYVTHLDHDVRCISEHTALSLLSTVCSVTHLDHDVRCISEHTALSLFSTVCSVTLVHIKLPIFNHILPNILGAPHKHLQFTTRYVGLFQIGLSFKQLTMWCILNRQVEVVY
jgi:hypothetical protein